jgi:3-oxoacyl-[acyl-carrier protein] reductase
MHDPADLTSFAGIEKMRRRIEAESGPIDIIVANACGSPVKPGPLRRPARKAGASVDGNLAATFLTLKRVLPGMKERGTGCVITMSSAAARRPHLGSPITYAAARGGDPTPRQRRRRAGRPVRYPGSTASPQMIFTEANQGLLPPAKQEELRRGASAASPRYPRTSHGQLSFSPWPTRPGSPDRDRRRAGAVLT